MNSLRRMVFMFLGTASATILFLGLATSVFAADEFCDTDCGTGTCEVNTVHGGLSGDFTVTCDLHVTGDGALNYTGNGSLTVDGTLTVDAPVVEGVGGQISGAGAKGDNGGGDGDPGTNGFDGIDLTITVKDDILINGTVTVDGGKGGNGKGGANGTVPTNGGNGGNGGTGGTLIVQGEADATINGTTVTSRGGNAGNGGKGGNRTGAGSGNGAMGGGGGNAGAAGPVTIKICGNLETVNNVDPDPDGDRVIARGGNGGNGGGGGNGKGTTGVNGAAGADGNGGDGDDIIISVDGNMTIADKVHAQGGNGAGTAADGTDGSITLNSTGTIGDGNVDVTNADFDPDDPTINEEQEPVCQCVVFGFN